MSCFIRKEVNNPKFPELSEEVDRLKETEGGMTAMCNVMENYMREARTEGRVAGLAEGRTEGRIDGVHEKAKQVYENCIARNMSKEDAVAISGYNPDEDRQP